MSHDLDGYWNSLSPLLPTLTAEQRQTGLAIYRRLATGKPLSPGQLAADLGVGAEQLAELLETPELVTLTYREDGPILGFGGLATAPMHHRLQVDGVELWSWCAWDSLFLPRILGRRAEVRSDDPHTGTEVSATVSPDGLTRIDPEESVVSFPALDPDAFADGAGEVMRRFCHHVYFFEDRDSARAWEGRGSDLVVFSAAEADELGRRLVEQAYGRGLAQLDAIRA